MTIIGKEVRLVRLERARIAREVRRRMNDAWRASGVIDEHDSVKADKLAADGDALHDLWVWLNGPDDEASHAECARGQMHREEQDMANHEIPFTRCDFTTLLAGKSDRQLYDYFLSAVKGQLETVEHQTGTRYDPLALMREMVGKEYCHFNVPHYLYDAWNAGTLEVQKEAKIDTKVVLRFHGVELIPWDREFIVASVDLRSAGQRKAVLSRS